LSSPSGHIITRVFGADTGGAQGDDRGRDEPKAGIFERREERGAEARLATYLVMGPALGDSGLKILSRIILHFQKNISKNLDKESES
jgi:hypothetical protein